MGVVIAIIYLRHYGEQTLPEADNPDFPKYSFWLWPAMYRNTNWKFIIQTFANDEEINTNGFNWR